MIEHICENCEYQKIKKLSDGSEVSECDYGYNTFVACQCAGTDDYFVPLRKEESDEHI